MIDSRFAHIDKLDDFLKKKVAINKENTGYLILETGETASSGDPDISWESVVYIEDTGQIYTNGSFYPEAINDIKIAKEIFGYDKRPTDLGIYIDDCYLEKKTRLNVNTEEALVTLIGKNIDLLQYFYLPRFRNDYLKEIYSGSGINTYFTSNSSSSMIHIYCRKNFTEGFFSMDENSILLYPRTLFEENYSKLITKKPWFNSFQITSNTNLDRVWISMSSHLFRYSSSDDYSEVDYRDYLSIIPIRS